MRCAKAPKAKAAPGPRHSRRQGSFSAAADLVVKPNTPPKRISGEVANASVVAGLVAYGSKLGVMPNAVGSAAKLSSNPQEDATQVNADVKQQEEAVVEDVATEKPSSHALVEVRVMSGETIVKEPFPLNYRAHSVKHRVFKVHGHPLWQQILSCQGELVNEQSILSELSSSQDIVFDLVLKSAPSPEDLQALADVATESLSAGTKGMNTLTKNMIREVSAFAKPPPACEKVCTAALHILAGVAPEIPTKRDGSPKHPDWSGCKVMMADATGFIKRVLELPSYIDQGRVKKERVDKCRSLIHSIDGDTEAEKTMYIARCSLMCQQLVAFLFGVVKYYDSVEEFRERFGGATITELKSHK